MNSIIVIHPYKSENTWVFDDEKVGLVKEPFVSGADIIIDKLTVDIPNADTGFTILFSANPFPGYQYEFDWLREECGGNWYYNTDTKMEGWLCPALFKYFEKAPTKLFTEFKTQ